MNAPTTRLRDNRRFAAYWGAQTVSQLGDRVGELALPLLAVSVLHATATEVGLLSAAVWMPYLVSLFVGSWVDRRQHKRRILVCADLARIAVLGTVPVVYVAGALTLWHVYAVAVLLGVGQVFFNTTMPSVFVSLVDRESYVAAGSALHASNSGSHIAGPALGGWLVQLLGAPFALLADALSFAGSALLLGRIRLRESPPEPQPDAIVRRAWAGLRFVLQHRYLRVMLGCSTTINFFNFVGTALLVLFARRTLGLSAGVIGLAFGIGAGGALLGAVLAPRLGRWWGAGRVGFVGAVVCSLAVGIPALAGVPALAGRSTLASAAVLTAAMIAGGIGVMLYDVSFNAIKTAVIPDDMRGRATGAYSTINYGIRPLGAIAGGLLGSTIGIRPTFVLAGIGGALSVLWLLGSPLLRVRTIADLDAIDPYTGLPRQAARSGPTDPALDDPALDDPALDDPALDDPARPAYESHPEVGAHMSDTAKRPSPPPARIAAADVPEPPAADRLRRMGPDDWHADLDALAAGLVERHRDPFHTVSPERFHATVARLHERIPALSATGSGTGVLVAFDEVAAAIGDGHTRVDTDEHYRRLPLELFWYGDQLRVVKSLADDPRVLGAELVAIGGVAIEEVQRRLQPLVAQGENAWYVQARSADRLARADVLAALGCFPSTGTGACTFVGQDGVEFTAEVTPLAPGAAPSWPPPSPDASLRMRSPEEPLAATALPEADATYANFRRYADLERAAGQLIAQLRDTAPARLILDLRDNRGGDYTLARQHLIYPIWGLPTVSRPGGLYVLIGRNTYSAAMVTATDFRRETEAVLVGEPTGARPVGCQETGTFELPRSGVVAHCAIRRYRFSDADPTAVFPDARVDPDWETDRSGHDAALDWCLAQART